MNPNDQLPGMSQAVMPAKKNRQTAVLLLIVGLSIILVCLIIVAVRQRSSVRGATAKKASQNYGIIEEKRATQNETTTKQEAAPQQKTQTSPAAAAASSAPASSKRATAQPATGLTCASNETYAQHIDPGALKQVENSVKTALSGGSATLTSWVPQEYANKSPLNDPVEVDKSFRAAKPQSCSVEFAYSVDETVYSGRSIVFSLSYKGNQNKTFASNINVSNVSGVWKTSGMSIIESIN